MKYAIKYLLVFFVSFAILTMASGAAFAAGNVNAFIGSKSLNETEWEPVDKQGAFGVEADFGKSGSPFRFAFNIIGSGTTETLSGIEVRGDTLELQLGVKGVFGQGVVRPFVGGGLTMVSAFYSGELISFPYTYVEDSDSGTGVWLSGGIIFALGHFNVGLEVGYSTADIQLFGIDGDAGGTRVGILLGGNW